MIGHYGDSKNIEISHSVVEANDIVSKLKNDNKEIFTSDHKPVLVIAELTNAA